MQYLLTPLIVGLVIFLFFILLRFLEASKRKKETSITDINQLTPRKLRTNFSIPSQGQYDMDHVLNLLDQKDLRVALQSDQAVVVHLKNANQSKFEGVLNTHALEMPVRIILEKEGNQINVAIEEDYGFQMFVGPAKKAFNQKYESAFTYYRELIEGRK